MYVIVGLGNPGNEYKNTRHNAGYMVIDRIARAHAIKP
ncbi:MAG: aminoacyl-tRNA hydrolase, partial [Rubrobacteridae bacterium]|nr:aminoacyl-tRNA hydrolase [Rubrobacteridae bacterium]